MTAGARLIEREERCLAGRTTVPFLLLTCLLRPHTTTPFPFLPFSLLLNTRNVDFTPSSNATRDSAELHLRSARRTNCDVQVGQTSME